MLLSSSTRFLSRLNVPVTQAERDRSERMLAVARIVLSLLAVFAIYLDPTDPASYAHITHTILLVWVAYSLGIWVLLHFHTTSPTVTWIIHGLDVLWPAAIGIFTAGPNSPFFAYSVFTLAAASYRWGMLETLLTAVLGVGLLDAEALLLTGGPARWQALVEGQYDLHRLIIRCGYMLILGILLGYVGETEKERRAESTVLNRMLNCMRADHGLGTSLHFAMSEFLDIFRGTHVYLNVEDLATGHVFRWHASEKMRSDSRLYVSEVSPSEVQSHMLNRLPDTFYCKRTHDGVEMLLLDKDSEDQHEIGEMPILPFHPEPLNSLLGVSFLVGKEWRGRLLVADAYLGSNSDHELRFAQRTLSYIAPALYSVYLVRRLRTRIGAVERARVARELHDGAIQSLIAAEMQVDILRRRSENDHNSMARDLAEVQGLLREEVLNLRELMQQMKPLEVGPDQLVEHMADAVDRFRRDTGIDADFHADDRELELRPQTCRELLRVLQEGLVNVRKHACATRVMVRFVRESEAWRLSVEDDGRGFDFEGRLGGAALLSASRGPAIIKERVRAIGGEVAIESRPGRGAIIIVTVPEKGHAIHG